MDESDIFIPKSDPPRGIIAPRTQQRPFVVTRWEVPEDLQPFVNLLWRVDWSLPAGEAHTQYTLPDPVVHVVFEGNDADVVGPMPARFERLIEGHGGVLGVHFRPGVFRCISPVPVRSLRDRRVPVGEFFGDAVSGLAQRLPHLERGEQLLEVCGWLRSALPSHLPEELVEVRDLVERMASDPSVVSIAEVARQLGMSERTLQRRFDDCVGWTPRQVVRRRRIHTAIARLDAEPGVDLATLALSLGYCDQAHFCRDFRALTGLTPGTYLK